MKTLIRNININYTIKGEGDNIVLLHGWGSNIRLFEKLIDHLSMRHKVYALDIPGFGESDEPPSVWCVDDFVDFVVAFMQEMGIEKTAVLGHSNGGRIIIKMASRNHLPIAITKIVLVDSSGILPKKTKRQKLKGKTYKVGRTILSLAPIKALYPDALEHYRRKHGSTDYNAASPHMRQVLVKVVNEDLEPFLPMIRQSTLLIWGEKDTATPLSDGQRMEQLIPDSGLVIVKGAGHYSYLEQPALVHRVLDSFFNG